MKISRRQWDNYISKLSKINVAASTAMQKYINANGLDDMNAVIDYAYGLTSKYGEAASALACQMYDDIAQASGVTVPPAEMAETADYNYTAKAVQGTLLNLNNTIPSTVGRLVKQSAADTTLKNALRDGAQFAWIPSGDTCAFCLTLASRGWQYMSKKALKNGHAEHIHANCNCEYAISFDKNPKVEGYDSDYYERLYKNAKGGNPTQKINYMRREQYAEQRGRGKENASPWSSEKIKGALKGDYTAFESIVNKSPIRGLYNQYSEEARYVKESGRGSYTSGSSTIHFDTKKREGLSEFSTLAHENGHMFDDKMGRVTGLSFGEVDLINSRCIIGSGITKTLKAVPSSSDEFLTALRKDMQALEPKVKDKSIRTELLSSTAKNNATSGVQDALDGFFATTNSGLLPWGHGNRYYNREYNRRIVGFNNEKALKQAYTELGFDASSQAKVKRIARSYEAASEAWANVASAVTVGGDELKYVQEYLPETYAAFMRIIGG